MMPRFRAARLSIVLVGALLLCVPATPVAAQDRVASDTSAVAPVPPALDRQLLLAVYRADGPVVTTAMRTADAAAYPLFGAGPLAAWGAALLGGTGYGDAYRLTLSEGLAAGAALGMKKAFSRPRPYRAMAEVRSRSAQYRRGREGPFAGAFPSGHAAASFALATSWSLSHPAWQVIAPSMVAATLISASRLWLGVHYPSDALAGALLGVGAAVGVHLLRGALTPAFLKGEKGAASRPMIRLRMRLP